MDGYEFKIQQVESRMIKSVLMTKLPEKEKKEEESEEPEEKETENIQE